MKKVYLGIPTLNEADNISRLVKQIDEYAVNLGKEIIDIVSIFIRTDVNVRFCKKDC